MLRSWRILLGLVVLVWAIISSIFAIINYVELRGKVNSGIAVKTKANITSVESSPTSRVGSQTCTTRYEYTANGQNYTASYPSCSVLGSGISRFNVYYDSRNPGYVISGVGFSINKYSEVVLFAISATILYFGVRRYRYLNISS